MIQFLAWQWIGLAVAAAVAIACAVPWSRLAARRQARQTPEPSVDGFDRVAADLAKAAAAYCAISSVLADPTADGVRRDVADHFSGRLSAIAGSHQTPDTQDASGGVP